MDDPSEVIKSSFDLEAVPLDRRGRHWHEAQNRFFFRHENGTVPEFKTGHFTGVETKHVRAATFGSDPTFCARNTSHVARDTMDVYFIVVPVQGTITLAQRGREVPLDCGRFSFLSIAGIHEFRQPTSAETHSVLIPGPVVRDRRPDMDDHSAKDFASAGSLQSLFVDYAASLCRNAKTLNARALKQSSEHLADMLCMLVEGVDPSSNETSVQAMHRSRAYNIIESRFRDPGFEVATLAQDLKLSDRYLQKLFAAHGETMTMALRRRRVAEACTLIDRRKDYSKSIASIAYMVGFYDPAYFSRVFRQHTGMSPLEWQGR